MTVVPEWTTLVDVDAVVAALAAAGDGRSAETAIRAVDARAVSSLRLLDARAVLGKSDAGTRLYAEGHLPGAVFASLDHDLADLGVQGQGRHPLPDSSRFAATLGRWGITPATQVVVYDAGDGSMAAARLWWLLRLIGHSRVAVLDGGVAAWLAAGQVLVTDTELPVAVADYPGRFDLRQVVGGEEIAARLKHAPGWLLDARAAERFRGEVEPLDPVAGHVPGAVNRPFALNVRDGRLRDARELRAELSALTAGRPPEEVVVMCGSGVTACHLLLAMEHAGLSGARVYAGSWSAWVSDPTRPVASGD